MDFISYDEQMEIARELEVHHAIFERIWSTGKIIATSDPKMPTACVTFDYKGNHLNFYVNTYFWENQTFIQKCFVLSHECMHVALNHGFRSIHTQNPLELKIINIAQDLVINHGLVNLYGYKRLEVDPENEYCWIDTVFKEHDVIAENETFEYYYNKIKNHPDCEEIVGNCKTVDVHNFGDTNFEEVIEDIVENMNPDELTNIFNEQAKKGGLFAGTKTGSELYKVTLKPVVKKKKWETVIEKFVRSKIKQMDNTVDQWIFTNRRFSLLDDSLILPMEHEVMEENKKYDMVDMWFFLDTSPSCDHLKDRFFNAARSVPTDKFNIRTFTFHTGVDEFSLNTGKGFRRGYGTRFDIMEIKIQRIIRTEGIKYPDAVFVVTDGMGNHVRPEYPERWYWFLSRNHTNCIPSKSKTYLLSEFY